MERQEFYDRVVAELEKAYAKHGKEPWGRHEFYAIVLEEMDEVWDDIKADAPKEHLIMEILQVCCVCLRFLETGDKYSKYYIERNKQ